MRQRVDDVVLVEDEVAVVDEVVDEVLVEDDVVVVDVVVDGVLVEDEVTVVDVDVVLVGVVVSSEQVQWRATS